jgi:hypothetical protein
MKPRREIEADPFDEELEQLQPASVVHHKVSWVSMSYIMTSELIGMGRSLVVPLLRTHDSRPCAGVLSLPAAFQALGWLPAIFAVLFISALTTYTGVLMHEEFMMIPSLRSYVDLLSYLHGQHGRRYAILTVFGLQSITSQCIVLCF